MTLGDVVMDQSKVYPNMKELVPPILRARIPAMLLEEIEVRYQLLGSKYVTEHQHYDGRYINGMMMTSRIDNCREEVVDAVFCVIGWMFKHRIHNGQIPDSTYSVLVNLIDVYCLLVAEAQTDAIA